MLSCMEINIEQTKYLCPHKKTVRPPMVAHAYNPSIQEIEARSSGIQGQSWLPVSLRSA